MFFLIPVKRKNRQLNVHLARHKIVSDLSRLFSLSYFGGRGVSARDIGADPNKTYTNTLNRDAHPRVLSARSNQIEIYVQPKSDYSTEMVAPPHSPKPRIKL